jgi:hypothetical protein
MREEGQLCGSEGERAPVSGEGERREACLCGSLHQHLDSPVGGESRAGGVSKPRSSQVRNARYACGLLRPWHIDRGRRMVRPTGGFVLKPPQGVRRLPCD